MTAQGVIPPGERERLHAAAAGVDEAAAEMKAAVRAAWDAGGSVRVIAAELGKSPRTIQTWLGAVPSTQSRLHQGKHE